MKNILYLILLVLIITGCTNTPTETISENITPTPLETEVVVQPSSPIETDFEKTGIDVLYSWQYRSQEHSADIKLFTEKNQFFTEVEIAAGPEDAEFYDTLVNHEWQEEAFHQLIEDLEGYGYDDDETARLALAMIANMPYEDVLGHWAFGYETLYAQAGVCADKTILAAGILDELGYDVVIFDYEDENHMTLGLKCQPEYAYWESYCIIDVTEGHRFVTDADIYIELTDSVLGQPDAVFDVSNKTKTFDAKWDYEQNNKLQLYLQQERNLTSYLSYGLEELTLAEADLNEFYDELGGWYDSRQDYLAAEAEYVEYLELFKEAQEHWDQKYAELQSIRSWLNLYESEYGYDIYTAESIGGRGEIDELNISDGWVII